MNTKIAKKIVEKILVAGSHKRLLVVGDVMLDEFVWGKVTRISPEAPVPIVEVTRETYYPGGAANVARNLVAFCKGVEICGVVGEDAAAAKLAGLLESEGISTAGLVTSPAMPTILKSRIIARQQQIVRVDREKRGAINDSCRQTVLERIAEILPNIDGLILQDYAKGLFTQKFICEVIAMAQTAGKIITADPNPNNIFSWQGIHLLKPNRNEAFRLLGKPDPGPAASPLADTALLDAAHELLDTQKLPALLLTLSEQGMLLVERNSAPIHIPALAREVFDVSGAGDTAIALLTLALCAGATLRQAAEIANRAASIVVGKLGTATVLPTEI